MQASRLKRSRLRLILLLLLATSAGKSLPAAEEPKTASVFAGDSLAEITLRKLLTADLSYSALSELDTVRLRELGVIWDKSVQRNRLQATLARYRAEAASATVGLVEETHDTGSYQIRKVYYVSKGERVFLGIVASVAEDPESRGDAAAVIARFINSGIA